MRIVCVSHVKFVSNGIINDDNAEVETFLSNAVVSFHGAGLGSIGSVVRNR